MGSIVTCQAALRPGRTCVLLARKLSWDRKPGQNQCKRCNSQLHILNPLNLNFTDFFLTAVGRPEPFRRPLLSIQAGIGTTVCLRTTGSWLIKRSSKNADSAVETAGDLRATGRMKRRSGDLQSILSRAPWEQRQPGW